MSKEINEKLVSGREYRGMLLEVRKAQEEDKKYIVEGYATTFNEPYMLYRGAGYEVWEQVSPAAFDACDMSDVIMQYDHMGRVFARLSNDTLALSVDERGLKVVADLGGTEEGRKLYEEIAGGYTNKMSFGFHVEEDTRDWVENYNEGTEKCLRTITKIDKLYDVSAVSIPANDATEISSRSFSDGVIEEARAERLLKAEAERKRKLLELKLKLLEV